MHGVAAARQRRREQTERARSAALQKWREAANTDSVVTKETLDTLTLACPSASKLLASRNRASVAAAPDYSLMRLALSSKQYAYALVAICALACQKRGLLQRLGALAPSQGTVRAFSGMWDEASQRMRAKIGKKPLAKGQHVCNVFVLLGGVYEARLVGDAA